MNSKSDTIDAESQNKTTPEGVVLSEKFSYLDNIINQYEIRHPKPSISRNTARKMLTRDLEQALQALLLREREQVKQEFREKFNIDPTKKYHVVGTEKAIIITEWEHYQELSRLSGDSHE